MGFRYERTIHKTKTLVNSTKLRRPRARTRHGRHGKPPSPSQRHLVLCLATDISTGMINIDKAKADADAPGLEFRVGAAETLVEDSRGTFNTAAVFN
ncbi:hypothetical protein OQA88_10784 [Cercophora sp. LCS_1]